MLAHKVQDWLVLYLNTLNTVFYTNMKWKINTHFHFLTVSYTVHFTPSRPLPAASNCSSLRQHKNWEGAGEVERPKSFSNLGQDLRMYSVRNVTINGGNP